VVFIVGLFTLEIQTYCEFFDKSTKYSTEAYEESEMQYIGLGFGVWQHVLNKCSHCASSVFLHAETANCETA
jgi:hypothetical protein